jgi:hypothetical protein
MILKNCIRKHQNTNVLIIFLTTISIYSFGQRALPFYQNNKWYFVSSDLKRVDGNEFTIIIPTNDEFFYVKKKGKYAIANSKGIVLTDFLYEKIRYHVYINKFIAQKKNKKEFQIDLNGNTEPFKETKGYCGGAHGEISYFKTYTKGNKMGILIDRKNGDFYYYDSTSAIYDELKENYNATAFVKVNGLWGVINTSGVYLSEPIYDELIQDKCNSGISVCGAIVKKDSLYGWLNEDCKLIIPTKYKSMTPFRFGYSNVTTTDNKTGYILENGTELFK